MEATMKNATLLRVAVRRSEGKVVPVLNWGEDVWEVDE
jgi:hypothetical protein